MDQRVFAHLEIHGHRESGLAFIEGFRLARGVDDVFFSDEAGFELPTLLDNLASGLHREIHVVAPLTFLEEMIAAMERSTRIKLRAEKPRPLSGAHLSFDFKFRCSFHDQLMRTFHFQCAGIIMASKR